MAARLDELPGFLMSGRWQDMVRPADVASRVFEECEPEARGEVPRHSEVRPSELLATGTATRSNHFGLE